MSRMHPGKPPSQRRSKGSDDWRGMLAHVVDLAIAMYSARSFDEAEAREAVIKDARDALGQLPSDEATFGFGDLITTAGSFRRTIDDYALGRDDPAAAESIMVVVQRELDRVYGDPSLLAAICNRYAELNARSQIEAETREEIARTGRDPVLLAIHKAVLSLIAMYSSHASSRTEILWGVLRAACQALKGGPVFALDGAAWFNDLLRSYDIDLTDPEKQSWIMSCVEKVIEISRPELLPAQCCFACGKRLLGEHETVPSIARWLATRETPEPSAIEHFCDASCGARGDRGRRI